jgi:predicted ribosome-associated RNA-binding protein Tma20
MSTHPVIHEVVLQWGLVDKYTDFQGLKTTIIGRHELSKQIVDAIFDNDLLTAGGVYGVPEAGDPIEVTSLQITHDQGVTEIMVYNLGIMLFKSDDQIYPRVLRVRNSIERQTERQLQNQSKDREIPKPVPEPAKKATASKANIAKQVYQMKVTLLETEPLIWRSFLVPSTVTLHRLHLILQAVMGWSNYHLYCFKIGTEEYSDPNVNDDFNDLNFKSSRRKKLGQVATKIGDFFQYEYDFGDSWQHVLLVEEILEYQPDMRNLVCLAGERACPPEDCGGPDGYADLLEIIADPNHEDYQDMLAWVGRGFDPDVFDIKMANLQLETMRV